MKKVTFFLNITIKLTLAYICARFWVLIFLFYSELNVPKLLSTKLMGGNWSIPAVAWRGMAWRGAARRGCQPANIVTTLLPSVLMGQNEGLTNDHLES